MANLKLEDDIQSPISKAIVEKTENAMGFAPNMYVKMGQNAALLDSYTYAYNSFRTNSGFNAVEQEIIFLSVRMKTVVNIVWLHTVLWQIK